MSSPAAILEHALKCHQAGQLQEAATLYRQILSINPQNADALHLFGLLSQQSGDLQQAFTLFQQAIGINGSVSAYHSSLGNLFQEAGQWENAIRSYQQALILDPRSVETYSNMGLAYYQAGNLQQALESFDAAIELSPTLAQAHCNRGLALKSLGRTADAKASYQKACTLNPVFLEPWVNLGELLQETEEWAEAEAACRQALSLNPDCPEALTNLALILQACNRPAEALEAAELAVTQAPGWPTGLVNLGSLYYLQGHYSEAIHLYQQILPQLPPSADIYQNLGMAQRGLGTLAEAARTFQQGLRHFPEHPDLHFHLALVLLQSGQFPEGFQEYEWRFQTGRVTPSSWTYPVWDGSPLAEKNLLVTAEQGYGDTLQFVRYLSQAKAQGGKILLECQSGLKSLLNKLSSVDAVFERGEPIPDNFSIDAQISLMSLPRVLNARYESIPAESPYLSVPAEKSEAWSQAFSGDTGFKIGIAWSGSPTNKAGGNRNCPLREFLKLTAFKSARLYSLQKGPAVEELGKILNETGLPADSVVDLGSQFQDFSETAAALQHLDLVITVDTSVAHLAGALGRPVWTLLPHAADWRWFQHHACDSAASPWYPTMRLFHQPAPGQWSPVFDQVMLHALSTLEPLD